MKDREIGYDEVTLIPQKTVVVSRSHCDTSIKFGEHTFIMPVYPANMKTVVDIDTCKFMSDNGWFYTMHRFDVNPVAFTKEMHRCGHISSISIGVSDESYKQIEYLSELEKHPEFVTIDIANAYTNDMRDIIAHVKKRLPSTFLIVGNVATGKAVEELESWGADATKVGISNGRVCTTRFKTGFGRPMISTILDCVAQAEKPIIADGGIVHHGDIAKALSAGATMVMAGSLFAGYDKSPGNIIIDSENNEFKEYYGSASEHNKGEYKHVEGKRILIPYKGEMQNLLTELQEDLRSSISYAGGYNLSAFDYHLLARI